MDCVMRIFTAENSDMYDAGNIKICLKSPTRIHEDPNFRYV
jgi:hypothetical protein